MRSPQRPAVRAPRRVVIRQAVPFLSHFFWHDSLTPSLSLLYVSVLKARPQKLSGSVVAAL